MESWIDLQRSSRQDIRLARLRTKGFLGEILSWARTPVPGDDASMIRRLRPLACSVLILGLSLPAAAQQSSPQSSDPSAEPFGEVIDVRVVNVEVVVTDREGKRVTGLQPGDFRLRVDGEEDRKSVV